MPKRRPGSISAPCGNRTPSAGVLPRCRSGATSAKLHAFACGGHAAINNTDHIGAVDQATNARIDVVGPDVHRSWTVAAIGVRPTTPRRTVERELVALGLRPLITKPVTVAGNAWQQVGREQLFLRLDPHEGDASFEMFGDLKLRCSTANDVV